VADDRVGASTVRRRWTAQDGNTLALFPAAVLVMFVLASMAIDAALTFSAHRALADIAAAAANDAASALGGSPYDDDPGVTIDPVDAADRVAASVARRPDAAELDAACTSLVGIDGQQVTVTCTGTVRQLVSPVRFLGVMDRALEVRATATPVTGP
jgi:hypothetical protein